MRLLVDGFGSIGRRHVRSALALGHEVAVRRRAAAGDEGVPVFESLAEAEPWRPDAIVVATPTALHLESIRWAVEQGLHAYVEKPLAASSDGLADTLAEAERRALVVAVGYNLRFHPALEAIRAAILDGRLGRLQSVRAEVGAYLPDWHPADDYRVSYAARKDLGGGALLTLSHELDYVRWIAGEVEAIAGTATRVGSLDVDVDDLAEVTCRHVGGTVSSVHQDLLDRAYNRRSRWVGETATIEWAWSGPVRLLPGDELLWSDSSYDVVQSYEAALADFTAAVERGASPRATGRDGYRVLELCEQILS